MQTVKVKRDVLLKTVKVNRTNHRAVFERAVVVFRKKVVEELEEQLERARKGGRVPRRSALAQPMDQTREYDQAIAMLEMSVDDEIEITSAEFRSLVLDMWNWKGQFAASNSNYVAEYNMLPEFHQEGDLPPTEFGRALDID